MLELCRTNLNVAYVPLDLNFSRILNCLIFHLVLKLGNAPIVLAGWPARPAPLPQNVPPAFACALSLMPWLCPGAFRPSSPRRAQPGLASSVQLPVYPRARALLYRMAGQYLSLRAWGRHGVNHMLPWIIFVFFSWAVTCSCVCYLRLPGHRPLGLSQKGDHQ